METRQWRELLIPYQQAVKEIVVKFESIVYEYRRLGMYSPIEFVTGRVKKISSILEKTRDKNIQIDSIEDNIEDIAGIRIICQFVEDIDKVVNIIRERNDKDLKIIKEKDYIKDMKKSGYRSFHIIIRYPVYTALGEKEIKVEIQIRTLAMNFWSTIEHSLRYKYQGNIPFEISDKLKSAAEAAFLLDKDMSQIRDEIVEAQNLFQVKSNIVADIINNIQNLYNMGNKEDAIRIKSQFMELNDEGDLEQLIKFNKKLDVIVEAYEAQSIQKNYGGTI